MKKIKILVGLMLISISSGLCGCGVAKPQDAGAERAAMTYIEEKYGQDAQIVNIQKNYKFTGPGGGLLPDGIAPDESYNLRMEMGGRQFDVCLIGDGTTYVGYDNYEEAQIKEDIAAEIENFLDLHCADLFLDYSELYGKYGTNMIHDGYSDLSSIYENGKFASIIATYDAIDADAVEEYATKYSVWDEKSILRIEIIQYKDVIPELGFSSFSEVNDPQYVLDWYTIWNGSVEHHEN